MKFKRAVVLLPCHSLEDFPVHLVGEEAHQILGSWSALWHPATIAAFGAPPDWQRVDDPPAEPEGLVVLLPTASRNEIEPGWEEKVQQTGALVISDFTDRAQVVAQVFAAAEAAPPAVSDDLAADFWALGTTYLIVELLTRQMRYYSNLDEDRFRDEATTAALKAVEGDEDAAREHLQICHDMLGESRNQFYPVDSYIVDLTLAAEGLTGAALADELRAETPTNLLVTGQTLEAIASQTPETLAAIRDGLAGKSLSLVGGEYSEEPLPLQSLEQVLSNFERGRAVFQQHLGCLPRVYGRRRYGLSPVLPILLSRLGYAGALHATLDAGIFPEGTQAKTRWESHDGSAVDALASVPRDARLAESILSFPRTLGEAMDMHHVACVCFAHWPGQSSVWYNDLRLAARYGAAIGKFVTLEEFFDASSMVDSTTRFEVDEYVSPFLRQAVDAGRNDPISEPIQWQAAAAKRSLAEGLQAMLTASGGRPAEVTQPNNEPVALERVAETFLGRSPASQPGLLVVNPTASERRFNVELPDLELQPATSTTVRAADNRSGTLEAVVDVPAMGFVYAAVNQQGKPSKEIPLAEGNILRNDHLEVVINPTTGSLKAIHQHGRRGNRLSQQLVLYTRESHSLGEQATPSVMAADSVEVTHLSCAYGEITSRGRLVDRSGERLADFTQVFRLWRGSRVIELEVELQPTLEVASELAADPWASYFASRVAWGDESAILWRSHLGGSHPTLASRFDAPEYVEIRDAAGPVTLLTGGLAYHRKIGFRMLDTLLIVRGEARRKFNLGIGVEVAHPAAAAIAHQQNKAELVAKIAGPDQERSAWLFHQDSQAVVATHWSILEENGAAAGVRVRLLETEGRLARIRLAGFRDFQRASELDLAGQKLRDLEVEAGNASLVVQPHEWVQVEAFWTSAAQQQVERAISTEEPTMIVTIDGPAGAGKSSASRGLAERLGFLFLDTGAMYRAVAYAALQQAIDPQDDVALAELARRVELDLSDDRVLLDGQDVTREIRTMKITELTRHTASNPAVRAHLVELQRAIAAGKNVVTEGRDQGTIAFPDARCKIFLTATPEERARRRMADLRARGEEFEFAEVLARQQERDQRDRTRSVGPLLQADDAIEIYTDGLNTQQVIDRLESLVQERKSVQQSV